MLMAKALAFLVAVAFALAAFAMGSLWLVELI
jgi:hypothetical protein